MRGPGASPATGDAPSVPRAPGYGSGFSAFYERHWRDFGETVSPRILAWLQVRGVRDGTVLDLCCGTGASSDAFVDAGWRVVGVDLSPAMVSIARARHPDEARVQYLVGDVAALPLAGSFRADVCLCLYDSLNHLPDEDALARALAGAARHTRPGGLLVADLNTELALRGWQGVLQVVDDGAEGLLVARGSADADRGEASLHLTGFTPVPGGGFERFDETDTERWFAPASLVDLAAGAGWAEVRLATYRDLDESLADPDAVGRLVLVARRAPV